MPAVILKLWVSSVSSSLADKLVVPDDPSSSNSTSDTVASTGVSFTAVTVKLTVASSVKVPSDTVNVKLSDPL